MSGYTNINATGETIAITVVPNGRVRYPIVAYRLTDLQTPVASDDANLSSEKERAKFLEQLPPDTRSEASELLLRLSADVLAMRVVQARRPEQSGDAPVMDEPWPDSVDGGLLLDALTTLLARYIVLPPHADVAIVLWLVHTYLFASADFTPYLWVSSPVRECGKSTLLELLERLAYRAKMTGGITGAALYRLIDRDNPTVLLDELDARLKGESSENLRSVLNTGFSRSGRITICVGDDHAPKEFKTFGPKVLAGIGRLWDTVASRSIPIVLRRATKDELRLLSKIRGSRIDAVCQPYRQQLLTLAGALRDEVSDVEPLAPDALGARHTDVWSQLFAIADAVGGSWPARARAAAVALHGGPSDETDFGLLLLEDIRHLFDEGFAVEGKLPSARIVEELGKQEDRPWPEYYRGTPLTPSGVAKLLGRFGVKPKNIRAGHGSSSPIVKGYEFGQLAPSFARYLPGPESAATTATDTSSKGGDSPVAPVAENSAMDRDSLAAPGFEEGKAFLVRQERGDEA